MAAVENRIVEMRFDNSEFERRVGTTIQSLGNLDKAIQNVGTKSGLSELKAQADGFHMGGMMSSIEGVSAGFIAMSTIAITALSNITNKAVDAGIQLAKSLTLDQVSAGFSEYELKLGSIQTIMAGSGESLDVVNKKLQELNTYSDQTIYSFADMTQNIGKFTNAGVDLDTAVASIKGIANVAALSGANAEEASRSMYNFAQALSSGSVKLMDWKSIELANMATEEFKQQLIDSAVELGTLTKRGDEYVTSTGTVVTATKGFNESLSDQWLTTDALNKTLGDYADATTDIGGRATAAASDVKTFTQLMGTVKESVGSGWAQTFELLFGNFDEAKWLFSGINDSIGAFVGAQADHRNKVLQDWRDLGGWGTMLEGFFQGVKNVGLIMKPIKNAFRDIFPPMTGERLFEITEKFRDLMVALEPSGRTIVNIGHIFKGLFNVLEIGWELLKIGVGLVKDFVKEITGLGEGSGAGALQFLADFGKTLQDLTVEGAVEGIKKAFDKIKDFIRSPLPVLEEVWDKIKTFFSGLELPEDFPLSIDNLVEKFGWLGKAVDFIKDMWKPISEAFGKIKDLFNDVGEAIRGFFDGVEEDTTKAANEKDYSGVANAISLGLIGGIIAGIAKILKDGISLDFTGGLLPGLKDALGELTGVLDGMQKKLKADALRQIATAIVILAGAVLILSMIDAEDLAKAMGAMAIGFGQLIGVMASVQKLNLSPSDTGKIIGLAAAFTALGFGALVLAAAAKIMSTLSWEEIAKGLAGIIGILGSLIATTKLLKGDDLAQIGGQMIIIGGGLVIFALAMKIMGSLSWEEIAKGLLGVAGGLGSMIAAMKLMPKDFEGKGKELLIISGALVILALAMEMMSKLSWEEMAKGLVGVGGGLGAIVLGLKKIPDDLAKNSVGILVVSVALGFLAGALEKFAELSWGEIIKGTVGIVATLFVLSTALNSLDKDSKKTLAGGAALLLITIALGKLAEVLKTFSDIGWGELISGLTKLAIAIGVLGGLAWALQTVVEPMALLGVALLAIGIGFAGIGYGAYKLAEAFVMLGKAGPEAKDRLIDLLVAVGAALPALMAGIAKGIVEMGKVFLENIPFFVDLFGTLITKILEKLTELIPVLIDFILMLVGEIIDLVTELTPKLVTAGWDLLLALLQGMAEHVGEVVTIVTTFISEFLEALGEALPGLADSIAKFFSGLAKAVGRLVPELMVGIGISFMMGFWEGIKSVGSKLWTLLKTVFTDFINLILGFFGIKSPSTVMKDIGINIITGLLNGIVEAAEFVWDFIVEFGPKLLGYFVDALDWLWDAGWDIVTGILNGIVDGAVALFKWYVDLPVTLAGYFLTALTWLFDKGKDILTGMFNGIKDVFLTVAEWYVKLPIVLVGYFVDALKWLFEAGKSILQGMLDGIIEFMIEVDQWFIDLPGNLLEFFSDALDWLLEKGKDILGGLLKGIEWFFTNDVTQWFVDLPGNILELLWDAVLWLVEKGKSLLRGLLNGIIAFFTSDVTEWFIDLPGKLLGFFANAITWLVGAGKDFIQGFWDGAMSKAKDFSDWLFGWLPTNWEFPNPLDFRPGGGGGGSSGAAHDSGAAGGRSYVTGFQSGLNDGAQSLSTASLQSGLSSGLQSAIKTLNSTVQDGIDPSPTITPVLALGGITSGLKQLDGMMGSSSFATASLIAKSPSGTQSTSLAAAANGGVQFTQINNSPTQLSTADIYRQTRNQITLAREELSIP